MIGCKYEKSLETRVWAKDVCGLEAISQLLAIKLVRNVELEISGGQERN